jgi:hypothetical protein
MLEATLVSEWPLFYKPNNAKSLNLTERKSMIRLRTIWSMALVLFFLLTACSTPPVPETVTATQNPSGQYPAPNQTGTGQGNTSYPAPSSQAPGYLNPSAVPPYPIPPSPTLNLGTPVKVVPFRINKPVPDGATEVTGSGPTDIPITLADITMYGDVLGETTIQPDGKFVFKLANPIEKGHMIGVALSDLKNTKWVPANFNDPGFNGDTPRQVPLVGFFFDTAEVGN